MNAARMLVRSALLSMAATTTPLHADTIEQASDKISEFAQQANAEGWTFEYEKNAEKAATETHSTGLQVPENWKAMAKFKSSGFSAVEQKLPSRWDWRERNGVTPIKNQGSCGSCWAFGTVAAFESAIMIGTGKLVNMSEQQLVSCSPSYGSCGGGFFAFDFYKQKGASYRSDFPYTGSNSSCKTQAVQNEKVISWGYVGSENRAPTTLELKAAIFNYGAVAVTVAAGAGAFMNYRSGVYNGCASGRTDHIVALVGWDDATQTWILKNSWGTSWGEEGYMRIKYTGTNGNKCNSVGEMAAFAVYNQN